jgi:hypothetical protein
MDIYHKHHVIPKHAGGTDEESNLISVTIPEHAELHRQLWEEHGRWQDFIAWKTLSGQMTKDEARRLAVSKALKGKPQTAEHIAKRSFKGKKIKSCSEERRRKVSIANKGRKMSLEFSKAVTKRQRGRKLSEETKRKISEGMKLKHANARLLYPSSSE